MSRPATCDSAEDITNHGVGRDHNPNDPDLSVAREVLNALHSAMDAAGPNGSIFVPEGTYYFGSEDVYSLINLGGSQPRGISVYGEGPAKSTLAVTEHMDPAVISNQTAFIYDGDADHGDVEIRGLTLDVNAPNLAISTRTAAEQMGSRFLAIHCRSRYTMFGLQTPIRGVLDAGSTSHPRDTVPSTGSASNITKTADQIHIRLTRCRRRKAAPRSSKTVK